MFHTTNQDIELKFGSSRFHMKFLNGNLQKYVDQFYHGVSQT
jgi:hypothetical protein